MRKLDTSGNHKKHAQSIKEAGVNKAREKEIILRRFFSDTTSDILNPEGIMISTTGSDGRFENKAHPGVRSNLELQIITTTEHDQGKIDHLKMKMHDLISFNLENIEVKRIGIDALSVYNNHSNLVFPTRYFDSVPFFDGSSIRSKLLRGISDEIMNDGRLSSKMYDRFRVHRRTMDTGTDKFHGKEYKSYNLDEGTVYYYPENSIFGVKNGPLRYVQYMLSTSLMRYIRDSQIHPNFLDELPTNIIDRLTFIQNNALTSKNALEIERLKEIYEFFLHLYHEMQYRHFSEGANDFIIEDRDALRDIRDMLACLRDEYQIEQFYPVKISNKKKN